MTNLNAHDCLQRHEEFVHRALLKQPRGIVAGLVTPMMTKLGVIVTVISFDGRVLDRAVHALDLAMDGLALSGDTQYRVAGMRGRF